MASTKAMPLYHWKHMPFVSALTYGLVSIAITLFNKAVLTTYGFSSTMTLTLMQGAVTVLCLEFMRRRGYIEYKPWSWDVMVKVAPLSFVFIAYVVVSLISLGRVNVPMFTALRRLTILFVMAEEYMLLGIVPSWGVLRTVCVMTLGAAIAAWKDISFDPVSYFYLFLTNLFTSLYTVYISKVRKDTGLNLFAMMYYNNITTMPFLAVLAWYTGDLSRALTFKHWRSGAFQMSFQASVFLAFVLNMSTFYCTSLNSARTQTVVGQIKNFFAFLLGLVLFSDYVYEPTNFFGLWVGFAGSCYYTYVTYAEKNAAKAAATPATPAATVGGAALPSPASSSGSSETSSATASALIGVGANAPVTPLGGAGGSGAQGALSQADSKVSQAEEGAADAAAATAELRGRHGGR